VQYTKNDWRNRNQIYSKNGLQWLTIPVSRTSVNKKISEVLLPVNDWNAKHLKSITLSYARAPHFEQIGDFFESTYRGHKWRRLVELNRHIIMALSGLLGIKTTFLDSNIFVLSGDRVDRLLNLLREVGATSYISGPSARSYLKGHEHKFESSGIEIIYKDYAGYPEYAQLSAPFERQVSILDLLVNVPIRDVPYYIWGWRANAVP